ncbi:hybrid sensor histidine kinase/response regulator, partial [Pseudoalteromonas sp. S409]|uniref:ATP-binding protein n=1 Tax=Pseudoalteromonas sp. S409 TaxID=2066518 RepID=UPI0012885856
INKAAQANVFKEFPQADSSPSRKVGGTGLGLSIWHRLIHLLNVKISFTSKENNGSTFFYHLRFEESLLDSLLKKNKDVTNLEGCPIFVADDTTINQIGGIKMLQAHNA